MQSLEVEKRDCQALGTEMEMEYRKRGLYWGKIGFTPQRYTSLISLETYVLTCEEIETLKKLEKALPRFLNGCIELTRRSMRGEFSWLWEQLIRGRDSLQVELWRRELLREAVTPIKRVRIDVIRTEKGLRINELTLGATGSGFAGVIQEAVKAVLGERNLFSSIAEEYVQVVRELLPNSRGVVGILLTPWRSLYGPEQLALTKMFNEYGKKFGIEFVFGFTDQAKIRKDGVYLQDKKLDLVERVFKEYTAVQRFGRGGRGRSNDVAEVNERAIIEAYLDGKVLMHPNLFTFLDYKELMAWLFDDRLDQEWTRLMGRDVFEDLKDIFAYTVVFSGGRNFEWRGRQYFQSSLEALGSLEPCEHVFEFEGNELIEWKQNGVKMSELGIALKLLGSLKELFCLVEEGREVIVPNEFCSQIVLMRKRDCVVTVVSTKKGWILRIKEVVNVLDGDFVLKLSGGDNEAAGGHAVAISKGMQANQWRKQVGRFAEIARRRTVVLQEFCEPVTDSMMICNPGGKFSRKSLVRTRICVWFWLDKELRNSRFGGNTVTAMLVTDKEGYKVHGRSSSAMTACSFT